MVEGPVRQGFQTSEPIFNRDLTAKLPGRLEVGLWVGNHRALLGWNCWLASASCRADRRLYPVCKKHHHQLATVFFCRCPRLQLDHGIAANRADRSVHGGGEQWRQMLSQREHEVLKLLADCKSNKDIAGEMNISVRTAETYRARVMMKLQLRSIGHLIRFAVRNNIIKA